MTSQTAIWMPLVLVPLFACRLSGVDLLVERLPSFLLHLEGPASAVVGTDMTMSKQTQKKYTERLTFTLVLAPSLAQVLVDNFPQGIELLGRRCTSRASFRKPHHTPTSERLTDEVCNIDRIAILKVLVQLLQVAQLGSAVI